MHRTTALKKIFPVFLSAYLLGTIFCAPAAFSGGYDSQIDEKLADNFNGKKWDEHIASLKTLKYVQKIENYFDEYVDPGEEMQYLGVPVKDIRYVFERDRFKYAAILFYGKDTYEKLKSVIAKEFGRPEVYEDDAETPGEFSAYWQGVHAFISLEYRIQGDMGRILVAKMIPPPEGLQPANK